MTTPHGLPIPTLDALAADLLERLRPRAKSLLVTIWGDSIFPRFEAAWLGGLIELARPFGLSERLVRTSVQRLSREDWLVSTRLGRRSRYGLTPSGRRRFEDARRRIYAAPEPRWDGSWVLVFTGLGELPRDRREALRRELLWLGFGAIAPNVFAHPAVDRGALAHVLGDLGVADETVVMNAADGRPGGGAPARAVFRDCWDLEGLSAAYADFVSVFRPVAEVISTGAPGGDASAFVLRTLMVHEYRRILLRDPDLPSELLPRAWSGTAARELRRRIHGLTEARVDRHVRAVLAEGPPDGLPDGGRNAPGGTTGPASRRPVAGS